MHAILDVRSTTINCQVFLSFFTPEDSYIDGLYIDFNFYVELNALIFNWLTWIHAVPKTPHLLFSYYRHAIGSLFICIDAL